MGCCDGDCIGSVTLQQGPAGATGAAGAAGATGSTGNTGPTGATGAAGTNVSLIDHVLKVNALNNNSAISLNSFDGFSIPANAFGQNGDTVVMEFDIIFTGPLVSAATVNTFELEILIGGITLDLRPATGGNLVSSVMYAKGQIWLTRTNTNVVTPYVHFLLGGASSWLSAALALSSNVGVTSVSDAMEFGMVSADITPLTFSAAINVDLNGGVSNTATSVKLIRAHYYLLEKI